MTPHVLDDVLQAAKTFRGLGFCARLNVLGGKATLDLERFASSQRLSCFWLHPAPFHVVDAISSHNIYR